MIKKNKRKIIAFVLFFAVAGFCACASQTSPFNRGGVDFFSENIELVSKNKLTAPPKTFEAWVKISESDESRRDGVIVGNDAADSGISVISFGVTADGSPWLDLKDEMGSESNYIVPANVRSGEWVHIAIVHDIDIGIDIETHKLICYVNGEIADESTSPMTRDVMPIRPLKIGGDYLYDNARRFPGEIADIRIWSRPLPQEEIRENMNAALKGSEDGLMANWLSDGKPSGINDGIYKDNSVNKNDARIYHEWLEPEFAKGDYAVAVVPDIQFLTKIYPELLAKTMDWIRDNAERLNIKFVIQVGDLTDTNIMTEWERARDNLSKLDGVVPYAFVPGNHDYNGIPSARDTSFFNIFMKYSKYSQTPAFGGAYQEKKLDNTYYYFTAGEINYMVLCLEMTPRVPVIDWANKIVEDNPDRSVIMVTHSYMAYNGWRSSMSMSDMYDMYDADSNGYDGEQLWENFVSRHKNIIMVLCGHIPYDDIVIRTDKGINGNIVPQLMIDAQDMDYYRGGQGMIALLTFSNNGQDVAVNWYSVERNALFRDWNQFAFSY